MSVGLSSARRVAYCHEVIFKALSRLFHRSQLIKLDGQIKQSDLFGVTPQTVLCNKRVKPGYGRVLHQRTRRGPSTRYWEKRPSSRLQRNEKNRKGFDKLFTHKRTKTP
jgi:hypothetical protein